MAMSKQYVKAQPGIHSITALSHLGKANKMDVQRNVNIADFSYNHIAEIGYTAKFSYIADYEHMLY